MWRVFEKIFKEPKKDVQELERYIEEFSMFLPLVVFSLNPKGVIIDANYMAQDFSGYEKTEIMGKKIEFLFKSDNRAEIFFENVISEGSIKNKEMTFILKTEQEIPVKVSASVRRDANGNLVGVFLAVSDISEVKELQKQLEKRVDDRTQELEDSRQALMNVLEDTRKAKRKAEKEKKKTRAALVSLNDGIIVFNNDREITLVNPPAEEILKIEEKAVFSKTLFELASNNFRVSKLYEALDHKIEWTGRKQEIFFEEPMKRSFQVFISPVAVKKEAVGLMLILHDITRQKEINRMKSEFVSIAAHQLRTPLSGIKWTLKMFLDEDVGELNQDQSDLIQKAYNNNERMINLINDLLNVARIEEGRFAYNTNPVSIKKLIKEETETLKTLTKERGVEIKLDLPEKDLPQPSVDEEKVRLVIHNLTENAIRYSPKGEVVTIKVKLDKMKIKVMIKDNGIGIPEKQQKRIFTKFFRGDNAMKSDVEGNGLGLFICKNIIQAHNGKIWFDSKESEGTTFWFTLPVNQDREN